MRRPRFALPLLLDTNRYHVDAFECLAHAELLALEYAAVACDGRADGLVLVTTLEPCAMCLGAAVEAGIDTVVDALGAPNGAAGRLRNVPGRRMPRVVGGVREGESEEVLNRWLAEQPKGEAAFARDVLAASTSI